MTGPKRLCEDSESPLVRHMIRAAQGEAPTDDMAMQRTLAALGVGSSIVGLSSGTAAAAKGLVSGGAAASSGALGGAAASLGAAGSSSAAGSAALGSSAVAGAVGKAAASGLVGSTAGSSGALMVGAKLAALGLAGGLLTFGALEALTARDANEIVSRPPAVQDSAPPVLVPSPVSKRASSTVPLMAGEPQIDGEPQIEVAPRASGARDGSVRRAPSAVVSKSGTLVAVEQAQTDIEREVALIDAARAALSIGNASGALRALNEYGTQFPAGRLSPEAKYLEMRARAANGDMTGAKRVASELLARHPTGPHSARAKKLLEDELADVELK